jgi:hypothetical protein
MADPPKGWTLETLFYHFNERIDSAKESAAVALSAAEKAITKSETAADKRFELLNEFRGAMSDASKDNITRAEAEQRFAAITDKIKDLGDRLNRNDGNKQGLLDGWKILAGLIGLLATGLAIIAALKHWQ